MHYFSSSWSSEFTKVKITATTTTTNKTKYTPNDHLCTLMKEVGLTFTFRWELFPLSILVSSVVNLRYYNNSKDLLNEIQQIPYYLFRTKEFTKEWYSQPTQTSSRRLQDALKRSRRLTTKQDVFTTSGKRRRICDVL